MIKSAWFAGFAENGALEPLNAYIQRAATLEWTDVFPVVRRNLVTHNQQAYVLPNDADFVMMYARIDLLNGDGLMLPTTWEDLISLATKYHGKDLNSDGVPDYGICWPGNPVNFAMIAMSIHASVLQSRGVSQGFFFDPVSGRPLWNNEASSYAFGVLKALMELSPFGSFGPNHHNFRGHAKDFMAGRCAVLVGMPGLFKTVMFKGGVKRVDVNGTVEWQPSEPPVHARLVGSTHVLDDKTGALVECTRERCPFATGEPLVNRPAFFGSGGFASAIASHATPQKKQLAFDFMEYLNAPDQSLPDVARGGFMDPYRSSHVSEASLDVYVAAGWTEAAAARLFEIERSALAGQVESSAMDLRVPFRDDFILEPRLPSDRTTNYDTPQGWEYQTYQFLGWVLSPAGDWVRSNQNVSATTLMTRLEASWLQKMTDRGGRLRMLRFYRRSLNLPTLQPQQLCEHHRDEYEAEGGNCRSSDVASTGQQRVYWTLSMFFHSMGLLLSMAVLFEFQHNRALRPPQTIARSFMAIAIPDFALSFVYFIFSFTNLLRGEELDEVSCKVVAFGTYLIVIATFCGPIIVSWTTYMKLKRSTEGVISWTLSPTQFACLIVSPWVIGAIFGVAVAANGHLGSYRGLYCYNNDWSHFDTGGLTMITFLVSTSLTVLFYSLTAAMIRVPLTLAKTAAAARDASRAIARRGAFLVACYFSTWIMFTANGFSNWLGSTPSIPLETIAALVATLPSIVDAFMLLSLPDVRQNLLLRLVSRFGIEGVDDYRSGTNTPAGTTKGATKGSTSKGAHGATTSTSTRNSDDIRNSDYDSQDFSAPAPAVNVITSAASISHKTVPSAHLAPPAPKPDVAPERAALHWDQPKSSVHGFRPILGRFHTFSHIESDHYHAV